MLLSHLKWLTLDFLCCLRRQPSRRTSLQTCPRRVRRRPEERGKKKKEEKKKFYPFFSPSHLLHPRVSGDSFTHSKDTPVTRPTRPPRTPSLQSTDLCVPLLFFCLGLWVRSHGPFGETPPGSPCGKEGRYGRGLDRESLRVGTLPPRPTGVEAEGRGVFREGSHPPSPLLSFARGERRKGRRRRRRVVVTILHERNLIKFLSLFLFPLSSLVAERSHFTLTTLPHPPHPGPPTRTSSPQTSS